ncbi:MAG: hypothetical protein AMXMBFR16_11320 [Candidatus Uhrbacteria bacterium]
MREKTKALFDRMIDIFGASDGGLELVQVKVFLEQCDKQAADGDKAAQAVIDESFGRMVRLLNLATGAR